MAMVIHHGGSGTTAFALRAGIPSAVVSFVLDQGYWGRRIYELGVGPKPVRFKELTVERLVEIIHLGTISAQIREKAAELGAKIRAENGIKNAIRIIEQIPPAG